MPQWVTQHLSRTSVWMNEFQLNTWFCHSSEWCCLPVCLCVLLPHDSIKLVVVLITMTTRSIHNSICYIMSDLCFVAINMVFTCIVSPEYKSNIIIVYFGIDEECSFKVHSSELIISCNKINTACIKVSQPLQHRGTKKNQFLTQH